MENKIGKVSNAFIVSSGRRVKNGTYITFETNVNVIIGNYVDIKVDNKIHCFEVMDISIKSKDLSVDACEVGYYSKFDSMKDFDLRNLIDIDVYKITDTERINKIQKESCYC